MEEGLLEIVLKLCAVLALVLANGFFVAAEFSLVAVRRSRVEQLVRERRRGVTGLKEAVTHLDTHLAATQLGITMSSVALGWIGEPALAALLEPAFALLFDSPDAAPVHLISFLIAFTIITTLHIVLGELMPKSMALQYPDRTALGVAPLLRFYLALFRPAIIGLNGLGNFCLRRLGLGGDVNEEQLHSAEELKLLVGSSYSGGLLHETQRDVAERVLSLRRQKVAGYMTPRTDLGWIDLSQDPEQWRETARRDGGALLAATGDWEAVLGVVEASTLLSQETLSDEVLRNGLVARTSLVLPKTSSVLRAFEQLRAAGEDYALVVDEYGEFEGLVSSRDIVEAIVGRLPGNSAKRDSLPSAPEADLRLDGMMAIDEALRELGIAETPADAGSRYHTLAGLVLELLCRMPSPGDSVQWRGYVFEVVRLEGFRIDEVRVRRAI